MSWFSDKKRPAEWKELFESEQRPVTLAEYAVGGLARIVTGVHLLYNALNHIEGMVGALDHFMDQQAKLAGQNYASSQEVREALAMYRAHKAREAQRALQDQLAEQEK